jgi:hypothetical protein
MNRLPELGAARRNGTGRGYPYIGTGALVDKSRISQGYTPGSPQGSGRIVDGVPAFRIHLDDDGDELVTGADTNQQEGPLTTFFSTAPGRQTVDSWSVRLASFRTSRIVAIKRESELTTPRRNLEVASSA